MDYSGMTLNERLVVGGFLKDFDKARKKKDTKTLLTILKKIDVDDSSVSDILAEYGLKMSQIE
jgi:hypothetical protein